MNLRVIRSFITAQTHVLIQLENRLGIPRNITADAWMRRYRQTMTDYRRAPFAKLFNVHGYGLEFEDEHVYVDYDYCESGRTGGFDDWAIYLFMCHGSPMLYKSERNTFTSIQNWLSDLERDGIIEKEGFLYYLRRPH